MKESGESRTRKNLAKKSWQNFTLDNLKFYSKICVLKYNCCGNEGAARKRSCVWENIVHLLKVHVVLSTY